jgi:hypothetical protein
MMDREYARPLDVAALARVAMMSSAFAELVGGAPAPTKRAAMTAERRSRRAWNNLANAYQAAGRTD